MKRLEGYGGSGTIEIFREDGGCPFYIDEDCGIMYDDNEIHDDKFFELKSQMMAATKKTKINRVKVGRIEKTQQKITKYFK